MKKVLLCLGVLSVAAFANYPSQETTSQKTDSTVNLPQCPKYTQAIRIHNVQPVTDKNYVFKADDVKINIGELSKGQDSIISLCQTKGAANQVQIKFENTMYSIKNEHLIKQ